MILLLPMSTSQLSDSMLGLVCTVTLHGPSEYGAVCACAGTWQQYVVVHVDKLYPVRPEVSNEDASQYFVNPCTGDQSRKS